MQTKISEQFINTPQGQEADTILRSCVHCGFCTATCPTYQLLGDELDSPRGRIYLIKQVLEGEKVSSKTQLHLDRCLTCRACETTCPSGVQYGRLVDIGREMVANKVKRDPVTLFKRYALRKLLPYPVRFKALLSLSNLAWPLLPGALKQKIPQLQIPLPRSQHSHSRKMLLLQGCAQSVASPNTNIITTNIFNHLGIEMIEAPNAGCCGAVSYHLTAHDEGLDFMRRLIDAWWPYIEQGVEAIVVTASGCGTMVKEYGDLLKHDIDYKEKAKRISGLAKDLSEVLTHESLPKVTNDKLKVAFHSPCSLQHGQKLDGVVENILDKAGFELVPLTDSHICCGSAGTYSILQPELSRQLLDNKVEALQHHSPDIIATANIGCQLHIATKADTPVIHWIELLNEAMG